MTWSRLFLAVVATSLAAPALAQDSPPLDWWQTTVFYQIYPRSFQDSDGDGIGDLQGITSRLEHLKTLGIGALWMSPIFKSPMADFGYDISNFYEIDPIFGTMADFDALIIRANELGLKVILDYVPNHSSDESEWFLASKANKTNDYSEFYIWRDPKGFNDSGAPIPPNEWMGQFFESVWTYAEERGQFYYHKYNFKQPDLNYRNDDVRKEMENVMTFWLDKGAHGFRVDTVHTLVEDESFPDVPDSESYLYTINQDLTYVVVKEWRKLLDDYSNKDNFTRVLMTEAYGENDKLFAYYGNTTEPGAHFTFNFKFIIDLNNASKAQDFVNVINEWMENMPEGSTANWVIGNHDQPRVASRYGPELAAGLAMLTLLLPGVGVTYNGEEIGMTNNYDISYEETQDPQGVNAGPDGYMQFSRDFERTPFQWDATHNAGFSSANQTWLPVNKNFVELNLQKQQNDARSFYMMYRKLIEARQFSTIKEGSLNTTAITDNVIAVSRWLEKNVTGITATFIVVVNFGIDSETVSLNDTFENIAQDLYVYTANAASGLVSTVIVSSNNVTLAPHASVVFTDELLPVSGAPTAIVSTCLYLTALVLVLCLNMLQ